MKRLKVLILSMLVMPLIAVSSFAASLINDLQTDSATYKIGDTICYTITLGATGGDLTDVNVFFYVPIQAVEGSCIGIGAAPGGTLIWQGDLPNGTTFDINCIDNPNLLYTIQPGDFTDADGALLTAKLGTEHADAGQQDCDRETRSVTILPPEPDIEITKSADPEVICEADPCDVTYTYEVTTGTGDIALKDVVVTDDTCASVTYDSGDDDSNGILNLGETWIYTCTIAVPVTTTNTVTAEGNDVLTEQHVSDTDQATVTILPSEPCIDITKTVDCDVSKVGEEVVYTICIENCGDCNLVNIEVTDPLLGILVGFPSVLEPGPVACIYFPYTILPDMEPGPVENQAHVEAINACDGTTPVSDDSGIVMVELVHPCIDIEKTVHPTTAYVGDTVTYTICIENCGDWPLENVVVNDPVLGGVLPGFPSVLDPNQTVCLDFPYTIPPGAPDLLGNCVTVESDPEGPMTNNIVDEDCVVVNITPTPIEGGGAILCVGASPTIIGCIISNNVAANNGGAISCSSGSSPKIQNCLITNNISDSGGGISCDSSSPTIVNCTFSLNYSDVNGAGICNYNNSNTTIKSTIFWDNVSSNGAPIYNDGMSSATVSYSDVQNNWPGPGNIDADPCFVELGFWDSNGTPSDTNDDFWVDGDYRLKPDSPCINAGDPNYVPEPNETELDGNPRIIGGRIDMGAYEYQELILPDLDITSEDISFDRLAPDNVGEPVTITATVWNIGPVTAENVEVVFYDFNAIIGDVNIPSILPGDSNIVSIQHIWLEAGFYLITVAVSLPNEGRGRGSVYDSDPTNNTASKLYQVGEPADMQASIEISIPTPPCYTEGTIANMCGTANYKILVQGQPDFTYPVKGGLVSAIVTDCNGLQDTFDLRTDNTGQFNFSFAAPCEDCNYFFVDVNVTDGSMTGQWQKQFCCEPPIPPVPDAWVSNISFSDDIIDVNETVTVSATACASADNNDTITNIPVTFYAYNLSLGTGSTTIGSSQIDALAPSECNTVDVNWTPDTAGKYRISARLGPGYSDENNGNNYTSRTIQVGIFSVSVSPYYAAEDSVVQITVDSRESLPSDELDDIEVLDYSGKAISAYPADPCHPIPTRWIYETEPIPPTTELGRASITVIGTDSNAIQHEGYGYFYIVDILPDAYLSSCDVNLSDLNPDLGEPITIGATVHARSDNEVNMSDIPVTFTAQHGSGPAYQIGDIQYTSEIEPGESNSVSIGWTNVAEGIYIIEAALEPDFSDKYNSNNDATSALVVGDLPFDANFVVAERRRIGRTLFDYDCKVELQNLSPLTVRVVQFEILSEPNNVIVIDRYIYDFNDIAGNDAETSQDTCTLRVDRSEAINAAELVWKVTYEVLDICQAIQQTSSTMVQLDEAIDGDISGNGIVDFEDLAILANQWLQTPGIPSADIAPPPSGDGVVNFEDFAEIAENWME
jgi:uncharacterized repeat protein (TIGR01451 family)